MRSVASGEVPTAGPEVVVDVVATRAAMAHLRDITDIAEAVDRRRVELVGQLVRTGWWRLEGAHTPAAWLRINLGVDDDTARRLLRLAEACAELSELGRAYAEGELPASHLDTLARAVAGRWDDARADEAALLAAARRRSQVGWADLCADWAARRTPTDAAERYAERSLRTRTDLFGDVHGSFQLPGDDGQRVLAAIDATTDREGPSHLPGARSYPAGRADALVELVCGEGADADRRVATTVVVVDRPLLDRGVGGDAGPVDLGARCDHQSAAVAPDMARRLACDASVVDVAVDGGGLPLRLGRTRRTFGIAQRRALAATYRRCVFPGCDVAYHRCQLHHVEPWQASGRTDLDNAAPLCRSHHHLVHEDGWAITGDHVAGWTWHPPPGHDPPAPPLQQSA